MYSNSCKLIEVEYININNWMRSTQVLIFNKLYHGKSFKIRIDLFQLTCAASYTSIANIIFYHISINQCVSYPDENQQSSIQKNIP